jgi:DNA-binding PucR family transcriptional regulator
VVALCRREPCVGKTPRRLHDPRDPLRATARAAARDERALAACRRLLSALRQADAERGSDLELTLRTYYERGASVSATAIALFLHRNSVRYRLDRVRALLGDIDEPAIAASLLAAFAVDDEATAAEDAAHAAQRPQ